MDNTRPWSAIRSDPTSRIPLVLAELLTPRRAAALTCAAAAICLPIAARLVTGPPGALVHVRWKASVDASVRQMLEARFRLEDGERLEGMTWRYDLVDPSPGTIRALVREPAVDDTNGIDRSRFRTRRAPAISAPACAASCFERNTGFRPMSS